MKTKLIALFFAAASAAFASNAGSFAPVTVALTITDSVGSPPQVLKDGARRTVSSFTTVKVTNAAILAECQRQGILTAGSVAKWKIVLVNGASGGPVGFAINNGVSTLWIPSVISFDGASGGYAVKGSWVDDSKGVRQSGATSFKSGEVIRVSVNDVTYVSTIIQNAADKVVTFGVLAAPIWVTGPWKANIAGVPSEGDERSVMEGALSFGAPTASYDLRLKLLGLNWAE